MSQDRLDLLAAREERRSGVTGRDGIARTRAESGHGRPLATVFGQVRVTRIAYRAPGAPNVHPLDAALNLPEEKQSHGLRKLAAAGSARGSFDDAAAAITRATGVKTGKRQVEQLARHAAIDVDAFYASRRPGPAPDEHVLVLTGDGKGIVMRPDALRPATAKAAASGRNKLATRLSPGEKHGRKRMAELACVYDAAPAPRAPGDIIAPPRTEKKNAARDNGPPPGNGWRSLGHRRRSRYHRRRLRRAQSNNPGHAARGSPWWTATAPRSRRSPPRPPPRRHHARHLRLRARPGVHVESRLVVL